jgi:hypothetical protein
MRIVVAALVLVVAADVVALIVWRINGTYAHLPVDGYTLSSAPAGALGGPELTAFVTTGHNATFALVRIDEQQDRVVITVQEKADPRPSVDTAARYAFTFPLRDELGSRPVIDGSTGREVPRVQDPSLQIVTT